MSRMKMIKNIYNSIKVLVASLALLLNNSCQTETPVTLTEAPIISKIEVLEVGANNISLSAQFYDGHHEFVDTGYCYNTTGAPTISDTCYSFGESVSDLHATLIDLADATTYYIKAYAKSASGVVLYSEASTVITTDFKIEAQSCLSAINAYCVSVEMEAIFDYDETSKVLDMGIIISTDKSPESANAVKHPIAIQRNMVEVTYSGLKQGTTYYAWSYIETEECGVAYSRENIFTTSDKLLSIEFNEYNSSRWLVGMHRASLNCAIDFDDSSSNLAEAGLMWSEQSGAVLSDEGVTKYADSRIISRGNYTICAVGLKSATTYYFRAYAQLADGTVEYSDETSITTYQYKGLQSMVSKGSLCDFNVGAPTKNRYWIWGNNSDYNTSRQKSDPVWGGLKGMKEAFEKDGYSFSSDDTFKERCTWVFSINKEKDTLLVVQFAYNDLPRTVESDTKYLALFGWKVKTNQVNGQIICTDMAYKEEAFPTVTADKTKYYKNAERLMESENIGPMLRAYFEFLFGTEEEPHPLQVDVHSLDKSSGEYKGRFILMPISKKRNPNFDYIRHGSGWGSVSNTPLPIWSSEE